MIETSNVFSTSKTTQIDQWGRPTEYQQITNVGDQANSDLQTYTSKYTYNLSGALIEEEYPSGRVVKNTFDDNGDLARIHGKVNTTATEKTFANSFKYLPDGRIERLKVGNGLWEKAKFNDRLQVTEFGLGRGAENMNLWKLNLEYGELNSDGTTVDKSQNTGNLAKQTISFDGLAQPFVQTYKYDSLYRIIEAKETNNGNQTWKQEFSYDRYGNRKEIDQDIVGQPAFVANNITHPTINPNTNRFDANQGYSYDKVGNLIVDAEGRTFTFDGNNKQRLIYGGNGTIGEYFYDGDGKRIKKKRYSYGSLAETVIFVYSGGKLVEEYSTIPPPTEASTKFVATDHLLSIRALSNQDGEIISRRDFLPFGEELPADTNLRKTDFNYAKSDDVRQKFTGYEKDEETGLDFAQARMYNNAHARFTAVDPLLASGKSGNPQTFNRYVYVMNSPLQFTDPTGLQTDSTPTGRSYEPTCDLSSGNCAGSIDRSSDGNTRLNFFDTLFNVGSEPMLDYSNLPLIQTGSVVLGTTLTFPTLSGAGGTTAATAGGATLGSVAAPATAGCAAIVCLALLGERINDYSPGGIYDNTVNRVQYRNGYPVVSTTGSANVVGYSYAEALLMSSSNSRDRVSSPAITSTTTAENNRRQPKTISLFHGSWNNYSAIITGGLDSTRLPTYVSMDCLAAANAISNFRYDVEMANKPLVNAGIIESRIPVDLFWRSFNAPIEYSGFNNSIRSQEIKLTSPLQINIFNTYIVRR